RFWIPQGRVFYSPDPNAAAADELAQALGHFFKPRRYRDPFDQNSIVSYDNYDLLMTETIDPLNNRVTAGARDALAGIDRTRPGIDYRVLQPALVKDPNGNHTHAAFDALGMVVGMATSSRDSSEGDSLDGFEPDLSQDQLDSFFDQA